MQWRVGTSGFSYDAWAGPFYPEDLPDKKRLAWYAERLPAVEINNTFYRMPKADVLAGWARAAPEEFRFVLKAPRRITHAKKDADPTDAVAHLFRTAATLGERLGPVLFQLPPWARKDLAHLRTLLAPVPRGRRVAVEFRHPSWLDEEVDAFLREHGVARCAADFEEEHKSVPLVATAPFGYVRLRAEAYDDDALRGWIATLSAPGFDECFVFFKHEDEGVAPKLALRLLELAR